MKSCSHALARLTDSLGAGRGEGGVNDNLDPGLKPQTNSGTHQPTPDQISQSLGQARPAQPSPEPNDPNPHPKPNSNTYSNPHPNPIPRGSPEGERRPPGPSIRGRPVRRGRERERDEAGTQPNTDSDWPALCNPTMLNINISIHLIYIM